MPYILVCNATSIVCLYTTNRAYANPRWGFFALGLGSVTALVLLEHRTHLPLPFTSHMEWRELLRLSTVAVFISFIVQIAVQIAVQSFESFIHGFLGLYGIVAGNLFFITVSSLNTGITEESFKVAVINVLVIVLQWVYPKSKSRRGQKVAVYLVGMATVALWALMHNLWTPRGLAFLISAFLTGMAYLYVIVRTGNYLPIVSGHALFDWLVLLSSSNM
jgi:hypothetical protein